MELANVQQKYAKVANKLKEITHSYHSLVGISTEMVTALETAVKEKMVGVCACSVNGWPGNGQSYIVCVREFMHVCVHTCVCVLRSLGVVCVCVCACVRVCATFSWCCVCGRSPPSS